MWLVLPKSFFPTVAQVLANTVPQALLFLLLQNQDNNVYFSCKQANFPEPAQMRRELWPAVGLSSVPQLTTVHQPFPSQKSKRIDIKGSPGSRELSSCDRDHLKTRERGSRGARASSSARKTSTPLQKWGHTSILLTSPGSFHPEQPLDIPVLGIPVLAVLPCTAGWVKPQARGRHAARSFPTGFQNASVSPGVQPKWFCPRCS